MGTVQWGPKPICVPETFGGWEQSDRQGRGSQFIKASHPWISQATRRIAHVIPFP